MMTETIILLLGSTALMLLLFFFLYLLMIESPGGQYYQRIKMRDPKFNRLTDYEKRDESRLTKAIGIIGTIALIGLLILLAYLALSVVPGVIKNGAEAVGNQDTNSSMNSTINASIEPEIKPLADVEEMITSTGKQDLSAELKGRLILYAGIGLAIIVVLALILLLTRIFRPNRIK